MKEYIEREAAKAHIMAWDGLNNYEHHVGLLDAVCAIDNTPTADVRENVRGEWVEDDYGYIQCSRCGMEWDEPEHPNTNFCPNCGAQMKEDTK